MTNHTQRLSAIYDAVTCASAGGLMGGMYGAYAGLRSSPEGGVDTRETLTRRLHLPTPLSCVKH